MRPSEIARNRARFGESGQASLNARGVRPVHRRKDRWNAAGSEYCRKNAMSPMLRLRSCSKARAKSPRTSSRIWRNDARSSARRRVSVRRLTASAVATASSVRTDCPRCSTSMWRTRVLMAPALDRSRAPSAFSSRRWIIPASAASASRIGRAASAALRLIELEPAAKRTGPWKNRRCSEVLSGAG